ncbi:NTP transferase domain-containing protein [Streptomyces sp. NPDC028722]|uniref:NTP transferase domain-containing protein n=1 Tax=Streptomyces sp. NPDC028722 TaxID=3155016 RepID=UPI0033E5B256
MSQLVVLCGGSGTRMAAVTGARQKCTVPVAGRPFLAHVLDRAVRPPVDRVLLLAGHAAEDVRECARRWRPAGPGAAPAAVEILAEDAPAGTIGALRAALPRLDERFLLILGDVLPPQGDGLWTPLARTLEETGAEALMALAPAARSHDRGNATVDGPWVARYDKKAAAPYIDRGVRLLRRSALAAQAGDDDGPFFGGLAERRRLAHLLFDEPIVEVGAPDRWARACAELADPAVPPAPAPPVPGRAEGRTR